jgi:hypothetical protein
MAISLTYGTYDLHDAALITDIGFSEDMRTVSVNGTALFQSDVDFAALDTDVSAFEVAMQKPNLKLEIKIEDDAWLLFDPATNTGFQTAGSISHKEMKGQSIELNFSFQVQRPSYQATGSFPIASSYSIDDAQRVSASFTGAYSGYGGSDAHTLYDSAVNGAIAQADAILAAYWAGRSFQLVGEQRNDKQATNGVIEFTINFIEKFIDEAYENWDIKDLSVSQMAAEPIGQPISGEFAGPQQGEKGYAQNKYAGTTSSQIKPVVKYNVTLSAVAKGDTLKFSGFQQEYQDNMKTFLWNHVRTNYIALGQYKQTAQAYIESDNTTFNSQTNAINVNWTVVAPDSSGIVMFDETYAINLSSRKTREKILDQVEDTYYSYTPGHKITLSVNTTISRVFNPPNVPGTPTIKPPSYFNANPAGKWDLDEMNANQKILARPAILNGSQTMFYTQTFRATYTWLAESTNSGGAYNNV